jgi:serine protease Do
LELETMKRLALPFLLGSCAFLGGVCGTALLAHAVRPVFGQPPLQSSRDDVVQVSSLFEQVVRRTSPSVVAIEAIKPPSPDGKRKSTEESGSGFLVRFQGRRGTYVLTNNHVIQRSPANRITVSLADNRLVKPTQVWADPESDVAVLLLEDETLPVAPLGDSDKARVGQWVLAFGSPFGLNQTVTHGILSARERGQVNLGPTIRIKDFLQTDAAINPGSSGGPLVNLEGEVIGINTAIASNSGDNSGVSFSIPINQAKSVVQQLLDKGSVSRGYLGFQVARNFEAIDAERLGLERAQGAWVDKVYPDTPAAAAGLRPNDVVLMLDDLTVRNENHLLNLISGLQPGQRVRLRIWRERQPQTLEAVVGDWAQGQARLRP